MSYTANKKTEKERLKIQQLSSLKFTSWLLNPIPPGLFEGGAAWEGGGGRRKVPATYNSKTINDNEMKLGGVVKDN